MDDDIKLFIRICTSGSDMKISSEYNTKELLDAIDSLSDDEVVSLSIPRPGHPGSRGYLWNPRILKDQLSEVCHALMKRLDKAS